MKFKKKILNSFTFFVVSKVKTLLGLWL
jgi:hypothetical protein